MTHDPQYAGCPPDMGLIESFLKYYIKRYGQQVLSQWRFEYSMPFQEPGMAAFSPGEYALFCEKLENLIHRLIPHASFGCFFGSPMLPWDFVESMVEELSRRHMNLNYISLHLYPYEPPKDAGRHHLILSTDPDFFLNYIRKFRKIYANYFLEPLPIYVTYLQNETAPCPWTNDSAFMAPFLFKTYTELYRDVANIAYSAFSDIIYKNNSDNPYFSGGNGIITFHGIKKPSYFALFMLSKTPDRIFYHHKNAFITSMDENTCQILMYNYVHYTAAHCLNSQEQYPVYQIYEKLQSGNIIEFSFDFSQWPEGSYRIQKFILGPKHGSVLDEFIRLGIHDDMLPIELDYLDRKAGMDISVEYIHVDRGTRLTARLAPLEICVYVVYPIL